MSIEIIDKLKQKNNGTFKLIDLEDVDYDGTGTSTKDKIEELVDNQITLEKDDTSFNGVDDTIHDNLTTTDKRIIGAINEVNSQCKDIAIPYNIDVENTDNINSVIENKLNNFNFTYNDVNYRGFNVWKDFGASYNIQDLSTALDDIKSLNANIIFINDRGKVQNDEIMKDFTYVQIDELVKKVKSKGYKVALKPMFDTPNASRPNFQPNDADKFFKSLKNHLIEYAKICKNNDVEILVIETECTQLTHFRYEKYWDEIINAIKLNCNSKLSISENCGINHVFDSALFNSCLINKVDIPGVSFYPKCDYDNNYTIQDVYSGLAEKFKVVNAIYIKTGKKVLLTETGLSACENALKTQEPGGTVTENGQVEQEYYYKILMSILASNKNICCGLGIWDIKITPTPTEFDIRNKKAFEVVRGYWNE